LRFSIGGMIGVDNKFIDCFGREITGNYEDVAVSILINGKPEILSGITESIGNDGALKISYQKWDGGNEIIRNKTFKPTGSVTILKNVLLLEPFYKNF